MKRKQILALAIAIAFTAQPQIANAAEPEGQSEVNIEATENDSEETEVTEGTEDTELIIPQIKELSGIVKAAGTDGGVVEGKLATVRVTNTDVYGIVGGKASLVGNYDQGQPAVPKDGIAWCYGDKTKIVADANKYGNPESTTMTLRNIEASQDGQTFCLSATNEVGTAYSPLVTLHVLDASVADQTVAVGNTATFTIEKTGNWGSYIQYQWYKGDQKISGATKAVLTLENVTSADAGEYKCVVQRGFGRADEYNSKTVTATLTVGKLATVRVTKTDVYGIVGGKASLVGNYDQGQPAVPKDGIAWCYGDKTKVVADANKYGNPESTTMTLRNIEASQDGQTFCLSATNEVGTAYSPLVTLHVLDASVADQTVAVGNTATFTVEKTGDWGSYIQYQWYKGDQKISGETKAVLTLENVTSADAGEYKCVVQRGFGRADEYNSKTVTATLTVGKLATVRVTKTDVYGIVGGKASLVGNYDQGQPAVPKDGIAWCYGDKTKVVADANKYGNPESTTMTLRNIEASQDGQTFCLSATNEVGTAYSPLVTLHVLDAKSEDQTALTDEDVTLAVETTGDWGSYVKYQWYKGTQKISGATKAALTLENVTLEDAGEYRCVVQKGFGSADEYNSKTVEVTLEVKERILDTKITSSHDGEAVKKGTKVSFKAEAIGDWGDELSYQWYDKDGKPIADQEPYAGVTTDTLTVTAQNSLDGMGYYCVITGAYGSAQTETSTLNVKAEDNSNKDDKNVSTKKDTTKKTESKTNPVKTGDSAQTGLWAVIAGLGLIEILEILKNKVKR